MEEFHDFARDRIRAPSADIAPK